MAAARASIDSAITANAGVSSPAELRSAQEKYNLAAASIGDKDYERARRLAREAEADARLAMVREQSAQSQRSVDQLRETLRAMREQIDAQTR
jgi:hypothetical protein